MQRESRVSRILRDARAAAAGPMARPETPRDERSLPRPSTALRLEPLPPVRTLSESELAATAEPDLATAVSFLRTSDEVDWYDGADLAARLAAKGSVTVQDVRTSGVVDALVRAMDRVRSSTPAASLVIATRELLCLDESLTQVLYTCGLLPAAKRLLSESLLQGTAVGTMATVLRLMASDFSHAFSKFGLATAMSIALVESEWNEVTAFGTLSCLSRLLDADTAPSDVKDFAVIAATTKCILHAKPRSFVMLRSAFVFGSLALDDDVCAHICRKSGDAIARMCGFLSDKDMPQDPLCVEYILKALVALSTCQRGGQIVAPEAQTVVYLAASMPVTSVAMTLVMALLSNVSFFDAWPAALDEDTLAVVLAVLFEGPADTVREATRVLGNITRRESGRASACASRVDEVVIELLQHDDVVVVYNSVGCLINFAVDSRWVRANGMSTGIVDGIKQAAALGDSDIEAALSALQTNLSLEVDS